MSFFTFIWHRIAIRRKILKERRQFLRLKAHHLIKFKIIDRQKELTFARNINAGGVLFYCKEDIPKGSFLELEINFPKYPHPVTVTAKVVRSNPIRKIGGFEIGAEFINVDKDLQDYINKRIKSIHEGIEPEKEYVNPRDPEVRRWSRESGG